MKFLATACIDDEYADNPPGYALLDIDKELATKILARMEKLLSDSDAPMYSVYDSGIDWGNLDNREGLDDLIKTIEEKDYSLVPEDFEFKEEEKCDPPIETETMHISVHQVYWEGYTKWSGNRVTSECIPQKILSEIANS